MGGASLYKAEILGIVRMAVGGPPAGMGGAGGWILRGGGGGLRGGGLGGGEGGGLPPPPNPGVRYYNIRSRPIYDISQYPI